MNGPLQAKVLAGGDEDDEQGLPAWRLNRVERQPGGGPPAALQRPPECEALAAATTIAPPVPRARPRASEPPCRRDPT